MPDINIKVRNKVAKGEYAVIVCDNSDYIAHFDFDAEWDEYTTKTARFVYGGTYTDVVFSGNECAVPVMQNTRAVTVGVYAGDLHTTTPAYFACVPSILFGGGVPADPTPDVYNQLMEMLNKESGVWYPAVDDAGNMSWTRSISETEPQPVNIKGPKGDVGSQGETGPQGPKGDTGATGPQGPKGDVGADGTNGNDGVSPTVSVAAITGGNRVTITDAEGAKTFDVMDGAQGASGADGKDYVLTDTDKQEIAEAAAGLVDVPSVQPDWNQNDSTQPDYVKNRPFYTGEPVEAVLVEESTTAFSDEGGGLYFGEVTSTFSATVGNTYRVYWDGAVYESVCADYRAGLTAIGNLSIAGAGADTGEPFFIVPNGSSIYIYTADTSASHTFSISRFVTEVVKIDEKYLPMSTDDSYGVIKKSDIVSSYNFPMYAPHDRMLDAINAFNTGNASIVWYGKKVIMARYDSSNDTISVVFANEPLKLLTYSNLDGFYNGTLGSYTYGELQGNQVRIVNDEGVYSLLSTKGTQSDSTLSVGAKRILFYSVCGLSEYELILRSSTEGSTKKFKITVDDSGAISATEVT